MVSNKKSRSRKKYQFHVNRRKLNKKSTKLPNIKCAPIRQAWKTKLSTGQNLKSMGLAHDLNRAIPLNPKTTPADTEPPAPLVQTKVVTELENDSSAPRNGTMRMPKEKVKWIEYLLDKYGEDYKAMSLDSRNFNQETPAQLKQKIKQFKKRPAYLVTYLKNRSLLPALPESQV